MDFMIIKTIVPTFKIKVKQPIVRLKTIVPTFKITTKVNESL